MGAQVFEGQVTVVFVDTTLSTSAPSAATIATGTDLTSFVTKDGLRINSRSNRVDSATIDETFDAQLMGSTGAELELRFKMDDASDTPFATLGAYGVTGYLAVGHFGGAIAAGDEVSVFPVQTGDPQFQNSASNEQQTWICPLAVTSAPGYRKTAVT